MKNHEKFVIVQNPMISYRLSHVANFVSALLLFALGMPAIVIYGGAALHGQRLDLTECLIMGIVSCIPFAYGAFFVYRACRIIKIMKRGTKVEGKIVSYYRFHYLTRPHSKPRHIMLNVRFRYHGEHDVDVHVGRALPNKTLGSETCSVYLYRNQIFVTDFIRRRKGEPESVIPEVSHGYQKVS